MLRREFLLGAAAAVAASAPAAALAADGPPLSSKAAFVAWMTANRPAEDPEISREALGPLPGGDQLQRPLDAGRQARLLDDAAPGVLPARKPRGRLCRALSRHRFRRHDHAAGHDGPHDERARNSRSDKVLEIGTGSGFQSALLTYLTPHVHSIEIIPELAERTRGVYDRLIGAGYREYSAITTRNSDGYNGWEEAAPFDKIIVTCGIDHIPPPLLQQLKPTGTMVIPVGPPGAQHILKVVKKVGADGAPSVARSDIFGGKVIPFVPLSGGHQSEG